MSEEVRLVLQVLTIVFNLVSIGISLSAIRRAKKTLRELEGNRRGLNKPSLSPPPPRRRLGRGQASSTNSNLALVPTHDDDDDDGKTE